MRFFVTGGAGFIGSSFIRHIQVGTDEEYGPTREGSFTEADRARGGSGRQRVVPPIDRPARRRAEGRAG